jgi:succinate dehydrogenase subunit C
MKRSAGYIPSPWPARLDLLQGISGLVLALFMWLHMGFVSSIVFGKDAFWSVARAFEGYFLLGRSYPLLVSIVVAVVLTVVVLHAALALHKLPSGWLQYHSFRRHMRDMRHSDTSLWLVQAVTGFAMLFLAPIHLYTMLSEPELIDPFGSADLVWSGRAWPMLLLLLLCVEVHGVIGLYRLALKWAWFPHGEPLRTRTLLRRAMWGLILFFLATGLLTLLTFVRIGISHAPHAGELYTPSWMEARP